MIAMAAAVRPAVLIADEPTTALDVTTQRQAMRHLQDLSRTNATALLLITHDIGLVAEYCSRIMVMYCGRIVESAMYTEFHRKPLHPYSAGLLAAVPRVRSNAPVAGIPGQVTPLTRLAAGCHFAERCARAQAPCRDQVPGLIDEGGRMIACHYPL